ncbi:MAG TPA: glycosyltransferase family 2 protein, partial [Patescibacteria group bacterium]|nr:glycosyltransferase family 2 protein [Patescibacteria group bacterium]
IAPLITMKKLAIVTVNYNTEDDTRTFLASLKHVKTFGIRLQTIVVDNGSERPFVFEKSDTLIVLRLEENTGFTGGFNFGIRRALADGADYVMVVNNDTILDPDLLKELLIGLESDTNVGAVVPKIYFAKGHEFHKERYTKDELGKVIWYAGGHIDWANAQSVHRGVDEVDHGQYDRVEKITFATGCCMLFRREVLEKVGMFDDTYFLYYEDADLSVRLQLSGYTICYIPQAILYHVNASSSGGAGHGNTLQDYFLTRNQMLFGMRYAPWRTKLALFRQSVRLLVSGRKKQKQAIRDYYLKQLGKGTYFDK